MKPHIRWSDGERYNFRLLDQVPALKQHPLFKPLIDELIRIGGEMPALIQKPESKGHARFLQTLSPVRHPARGTHEPKLNLRPAMVRELVLLVRPANAKMQP